MCVLISNLPLLNIVCMLPAGKIVALPAVNHVVIVFAPFSACMKVVVLPMVATTQFAALGWK